MIRRPPRSTLSSSSAASDVYKRQVILSGAGVVLADAIEDCKNIAEKLDAPVACGYQPVSYTHLRAHETKANLVCRLLLEKKKKKKTLNESSIKNSY